MIGPKTHHRKLKFQITDLVDIIAEHGKPIILDCSVYPEAKEKILEAVNQGNNHNKEKTSFEVFDVSTATSSFKPSVQCITPSCHIINTLPQSVKPA